MSHQALEGLFLPRSHTPAPSRPAHTNTTLWCKCLPLFDHLPPPMWRKIPLLGFYTGRNGLLKPLLCPQGKFHSEQERARQAQPPDETSPSQIFAPSKLGVVFRLHLPGGKYREAGPASGGLLLPAGEGPSLGEAPSAEGTPRPTLVPRASSLSGFYAQASGSPVSELLILEKGGY